MRCTNQIAKATFGKKGGKTKLIRRRPEWKDSPDVRTTNYTLVPDDAGVIWSQCPGTLKINIEAYDEAEWGGSHAKLKVTFECSHCGPNELWTPATLPSDFDLVAWVNTLMNQVETVPFKDVQQIDREKSAVQKALIQKLRAEGMADGGVIVAATGALSMTAEEQLIMTANRIIYDFIQKRHNKNDPNWTHVNMENAKEAGLL